MRGLKKFANSLSVVGSTQISPTALRDLIFMVYKLVPEWSKYTPRQQKMVNVFQSIKQRCENQRHISYHLYGGRGIKCEWASCYQFCEDMSEGFKEGLSIDRIDPNGNYCKENCRWADSYTQNNNKRTNVIVEGGLTLSQWCKKKGIEDRYSFVRYKYSRGNSLDEILERIDYIKRRKELSNIKGIGKEKRKKYPVGCVYQFTISGNLIKKWWTIKIASDSLKIDIEVLHNTIESGQGIFNGYKWCKTNKCN